MAGEAISTCSMFLLTVEFLILDEKPVAAKAKPEHDGFWFHPEKPSVDCWLLIDFPSEEPHKLEDYSVTSAVIMKCLLNI